MRPIDADAIKLDYSGLAYFECHDAAGIAEYFAQQIREIPTLTPQNEALTLNELLDINHAPIWVVDIKINRGEWCYWKDGRAYSCESPPEYYEPDDYGQWVAYRRPPEGEEDT